MEVRTGGAQQNASREGFRAAVVAAAIIMTLCMAYEGGIRQEGRGSKALEAETPQRSRTSLPNSAFGHRRPPMSSKFHDDAGRG